MARLGFRQRTDKESPYSESTTPLSITTGGKASVLFHGNYLVKALSFRGNWVEAVFDAMPVSSEFLIIVS